MKFYVICSLVEKDEETEEPLFWSNKDGWVFLATATVFTAAERKWATLPFAEKRPVWVELPTIPTNI